MRDVLFGGEGEDTFIYLNTSHSLTGKDGFSVLACCVSFGRVGTSRG
ncbi:hypothetical protein [uncultured Roseovarius sp.]|nr:hypothetical protein [uncultured Roseovarius sp.]